LIRIEDFEIKASSWAEDIKWTAMDEIPELAFDHNFILSETYALLKQKLLNEPVCFDLLPERYTLNEMQQLYEFALETEMDKANFRKKIKYVPMIAHDEKQQNVKHRPAKLFSFNKEEYSNQVAKKDYQFKM
jgi:8-oxo-dGTP diphosphatase